ncbi:hypothetical protein CEXT_563571 [Caerostris extrusa]|uniref:Uncharacterized protein n=1 Tax=Caerostris extrusa TaxID=172846 RepID=A0AAV4XJT1_CAEEX|nr:hypothetical protein CEXT_563571 [Caerostris extrusa]
MRAPVPEERLLLQPVVPARDDWAAVGAVRKSRGPSRDPSPVLLQPLENEHRICQQASDSSGRREEISSRDTFHDGYSWMSSL